MISIARNARFGAVLALSTLCAMTLAPAAQAQFGFPFPGSPGTTPGTNPGAQQDQYVGTVLTVPLKDFGQIVAQNVIRQKNVNLLQVSQTAIGDMNTQVATISIRQKNDLSPSSVCYLPVASLNWVKQANKNTTIVEQGAIGFGNTQVAQVQVSQDNSLKVPKGTKFMMCPLWAAPTIQSLNQKNINVVHVSQLAIGDNNSQVALLSVDQSNSANLNVPTGAINPLVQLNLNLSIVTQVAIGNGNTQVATVDVGQSNGL